MNLHTYTFVALDLETTGLDPHKDTIIEVAAVRFKLEQDGDIYRAIEQEERSMLINPGRNLEENIAMITGISDNMLIRKQKWEEVQNKVATFIGDSIIVGHNVLFDINMLSTHGVDLSKHLSIDTFELSEIFSQDAESLNLGFLGKKYKIEMESEHRALDDTKLSLELFCRYLHDIFLLEWERLTLWQHACIRDTSDMIALLLEITQKTEQAHTFFLPIPPTSDRLSSWKKKDIWILKENNYTIVSLGGGQSEEIELVRSSLTISSPLLIIAPNKKQSSSIWKNLHALWYSASIYKDKKNFCSLEMLSYWLARDSWKRKESIFILKLASWILETKTWLLDELKYYGDERTLMELFRSPTNEKNYFFDRQKEASWKADILIADLCAENIDKEALIEWKHSLIIRDIPRMEDIIRRKESSHISFSEIFSLCESLKRLEKDDVWDDLITGFSMISEIYRSTPDRPKWGDEFPPGDFGETYLITQRDVWHTGYKWLILSTLKLQWVQERIHSIQTENPIDHQNKIKLERYIDILIRYSLIEDTNTSIVLSIMSHDMKISFIPRDIRNTIQNTLITQYGQKNTLVGYGIQNRESEQFLQKECAIVWEIQGKNNKKILILQKQASFDGDKIVILTTNMKHARMLANEYKWKFNIKYIYTQGLSGGKGKMLSLFIQAKEKSLLIGIIDTWIDEGDLWEHIDTLIISKVPFDPPTDPYFLARTVGMKNNFEEYSTPIAINTLNTLIGRTFSANPKIQIFCTDERLTTMNWGQSMKNFLL